MSKLYINKEEIEQLEKQRRVHLINSLGGFKSVALVGTISNNGKPIWPFLVLFSYRS